MYTSDCPSVQHLLVSVSALFWFVLFVFNNDSLRQYGFISLWQYSRFETIEKSDKIVFHPDAVDNSMFMSSIELMTGLY